MRAFRFCIFILMLVPALASAGCRRDSRKQELPEEIAVPAAANDMPAAPRVVEPPALPEPLQAPYGPVDQLGKTFCGHLTAGDYAALADMFSATFLIKVNPKFQELSEEDALRDMEGKTPKAIEDSLRQAHTLPVSECRVETTELRNCEDTAVLANDSYSGDVTAKSFMAAVADMSVTQCGILQVRETSNAGILYSQIIVGNLGDEWKLLLGMN